MQISRLSTPLPCTADIFEDQVLGRYPHYSLPNIYINMKVDQKVLHSSMKSLTQMRELCIIVKILWLAFLICSMLCIGWIVTHKFGKLSQLYVKKWQSVEVGCIEHISAHVGHGRTNLCQANISSWIWFVPQVQEIDYTTNLHFVHDIMWCHGQLTQFFTNVSVTCQSLCNMSA